MFVDLVLFVLNITCTMEFQEYPTL